MRITVAELVKMHDAIQHVDREARRIEKERAIGIMQDEQHKMNVRVKQCAQKLAEEACRAPAGADVLLRAAVLVRDMLDDRPPPESDPDAAKRFPSMFRGGPV